MSCSTPKPLSENEIQESSEHISKNENLLEGTWTLEYMTPVDGKDVKQLYKIQMPYLTFVDEVKVAGNNGCNNIAGSYNAEGEVIHFDTENFKSTRMFCENVNEEAFLDILKTINRFQINDDGKTLVLLTSDIFSMSFKKTE